MSDRVRQLTFSMPGISHKCGLVQALVTARALLRQPRQTTPSGPGHELERLKELAREMDRLTRYEGCFGDVLCRKVLEGYAFTTETLPSWRGARRYS